MLPKSKKRLSQNFLVNKGIIEKIINAAEIKKGETVLEIGPGTGVLTEALVSAGAKVVAVEADKGLIPYLKEKFGDKIELVHGDILNRRGGPMWLPSESMWPPDHKGRHMGLPLRDNKYKLIANLPYHITSEILERFLSKKPKPSQMVLMVQNEVADRIIAKPPKMSLLSVVCQIYADVKKIAKVSKGSFRPIPKVDSAIVSFNLRATLPNPPLVREGSERSPSREKQAPPLSRGDEGGLSQGVADPESIIKLAKIGFSSRRKQLHRNLSDAGITTSDQVKISLEKIGLDPKSRAENLRVEDWVGLYKDLTK